MEWSVMEILDRLQARDECQKIEAKEARKKLGKSALETISAFSNEPDMGGGYLVLGLRERSSDLSESPYVIEGVQAPDRVQRELAGACRNDFNVRITPIVAVETIDNKAIIVAFIPEAFCRQKPVYIERKGVEEGCYRRIGSADFRCTQEDLDLLYQLRRQRSFESEMLPNVTWDDISSDAIGVYRRVRSQVDPGAEELNLDDRELLLSLRSAVVQDGEVVPTVSGLLLFGSNMALRRELPFASRVDYIVVEGSKWVPSGSRRYEFAIEYREALVSLMPKLQTQIMNDLPKAFGLDEARLHRVDTPQIPRGVIREALANALMHRDYREHQPTQIIRYSNRLEFRNAGYSLKPIEELGEPGSKSRNPAIANVFHDLKHAEIKGTGIRSMKKRMREAGLATPPIIESERSKNEFDLILMPHHLLGAEMMGWLSSFKELRLTDHQRIALAFTKEVGAITNQDYRQLTGVDTLAASKALVQLRELDLLVSLGAGNGTYYVLGERASAAVVPASSPDKDSAYPIGLPDKDSAYPISLPDKPESQLKSEQVHGLPAGFPPLSEELKDRIRRLGQRTPEAGEVKDLVKILCSLRPLKRSELAKVLGRKPKHLSGAYLSEMIASGELVYVYPENPTHPKQAYKTSDGNES